MIDLSDFVKEVKFKKVMPTATIPKYTRYADACLDLTCATNIILDPGATAVIPTGLAIELPKGFEGRIRGRSGLASKGIYVHHGTIDEEYRGEIGIIITNNSSEDIYLHIGDRIAQFSISPVYKIVVREVDEVLETNRGSLGFGSSGLQ